MKTICLLGVSRSLKTKIIAYFLKNKSIIVENNEINISGNKYLINFDSQKALNNRSSVYLFGGKRFNKNIKIPEESICICSSTDTKALCFLFNKKVSVITCGLSTTDTFTYSSFEENKIISLQRPIATLNGKLLEPFEFENAFSLKNDEEILLFNSLITVVR